MNLPSYKSQFDKITEAYIKGEIEPRSANFCFCGTLAKHWIDADIELGHHYTLPEYGKMEYALFSTFPEIRYIGIANIDEGATGGIKKVKNYEGKLFNGMCAALDVLKQIHIERGEIIEEGIPVFKKRDLCVN